MACPCNLHEALASDHAATAKLSLFQRPNRNLSKPLHLEARDVLLALEIQAALEVFRRLGNPGTVVPRGGRA